MGDTGPVSPRTDAPDLTAPPQVGLACSAKGCRRPAAWSLRWNNPRLHTAERRKTWLACDEHLGHLTEFLQLRGFLRDTVPLDDLVEAGTAV